jgi:NAD-dependent SIR2 family protein deacetylase
MATMICKKCEDEFDPEQKRQKAGKINECDDCSEEVAVRYTGNQIYDHKTGVSVQINKDPNLTQYILKATQLRSRNSNLHYTSFATYSNKTVGACLYTAGDKMNAKGKL